MNLFEELKRRNVIKATITYVVVSWVLLQVASLILPIIGAPELMSWSHLPTATRPGGPGPANDLTGRPGAARLPHWSLLLGYPL